MGNGLVHLPTLPPALIPSNPSLPIDPKTARRLHVTTDEPTLYPPQAEATIDQIHSRLRNAPVESSIVVSPSAACNLIPKCPNQNSFYRQGKLAQETIQKAPLPPSHPGWSLSP